MKKIMLVMTLGLMVSAAVPAFAQNRGYAGAAAAGNAAANAGAGSVLDGVLSGMGQGGGSAKAGISSLLGGDVAKIMPAAGDKRNKRFNKHGKGGGRSGGSSLIAPAPAASVAPSAPAASHSNPAPSRVIAR